MRLTGMQPVARTAGPFATVCIDVSRATENAEQELGLRWKAVARMLRADGAPDHLVDQVAERVLEPTSYGGGLRRYVVATGSDILVDTVVPRPRAQVDYGRYGPLPHLMPLARLWAGATPYVLVTVDHTGADIVCADATGLDVERWRTEGDHDVIHKVPGGGWSQRRYQSRVEDSWDRNGEQVAADLDKLVAERPGEPVFLVGDPYARSVVHTYATGRVAGQLTDLGHGSRAAGSSDQPVEHLIAGELSNHRAAVRDRLLGSYVEGLNRSDRVATNLTEVVRALREGSLDVLLLVDRPESIDRLWAGPRPTQLAPTADELADLDVDERVEEPAAEVLLRALADTDGDLELLDEPLDLLPDGVGGLLRFDSSKVRS